MDDAELENLRKQCVSNLYKCSENVIKNFQEEQEEKLTTLKFYLERYCIHEAEQNVLREVSEKIKSDSNASNINSINKRFDKYLKDMTKRVKVKDHPSMLKMMKVIEKGQTFRDGNLDESDVAITQTEEAFIDPLTMRVIQDPVRNTLCGHVYEREAIIAHIRGRKKKTLCPVVGCRNTEPLRVEQLVPDEDIRLRVTQMLNRSVDNEAESVDESIDTL
ncbi:E3 SUMO-protein ligase NSE2 [Danaus plexippus plexippus]|uniref:E3 SUMO-protein ligase NSE2 n=1 Tax=Danaus plexippus plexippus TaxID=278856 RepID=A0A212F5S7_DANPL|nr:E3 SUMO-protein ligase NSE2 [Danaus plexippus plexippus]